MSHSPSVSPADTSHLWAPTRFACTSSPDGWGSVCLHLAGELDLATCPRFEQVLKRSQNDKSIVSVDLQDLTFVDGAGLNAIVQAGARAVAAKTRLILVGATGQVGRLLDLTGPLPTVERVAPGPQGNRVSPVR
jgi:anti-anti-sigma factor